MDEDTSNKNWIELKGEYHDQALAEYNYALAVDIEQDVRDAGFAAEAKTLATNRHNHYHNDELLGETDESDALREQEIFS